MKSTPKVRHFWGALLVGGIDLPTVVDQVLAKQPGKREATGLIHVAVSLIGEGVADAIVHLLGGNAALRRDNAVGAIRVLFGNRAHSLVIQGQHGGKGGIQISHVGVAGPAGGLGQAKPPSTLRGGAELLRAADERKIFEKLSRSSQLHHSFSLFLLHIKFSRQAHNEE